MKKLVLVICFLPFFVFSQNMDNKKLQNIYESVSDSIQGNAGAWQFHIKETLLISFTDENHNRMRIISPIADSNSLGDELIKASLIANFHTALDVKYAISEGVLWSVFTHPLKELSEDQVKDAVSQVYYAHINFGTTFTSTSLTFPGSEKEVQEDEKIEAKPKFRKS